MKRMCIGCGLKGHPTEFIRFLAVDGEIQADETGHGVGRGAYLCYNATCLAHAIRKNAFSRAFRQTLKPLDAKTLQQRIRLALGAKLLRILYRGRRLRKVEFEDPSTLKEEEVFNVSEDCTDILFFDETNSIKVNDSELASEIRQLLNGLGRFTGPLPVCRSRRLRATRQRQAKRKFANGYENGQPSQTRKFKSR